MSTWTNSIILAGSIIALAGADSDAVRSPPITLKLSGHADHLLAGTEVHVSITPEWRLLKQQRQRNRMTGETRTVTIVRHRVLAEGDFDWSFLVPKTGTIPDVMTRFEFAKDDYVAARSETSELLVHVVFSVSLPSADGHPPLQRQSGMDLLVSLDQHETATAERCLRVGANPKTKFEIVLLPNCTSPSPSEMSQIKP